MFTKEQIDEIAKANHPLLGKHKGKQIMGHSLKSKMGGPRLEKLTLEDGSEIFKKDGKIVTEKQAKWDSF